MSWFKRRESHPAPQEKQHTPKETVDVQPQIEALRKEFVQRLAAVDTALQINRDTALAVEERLDALCDALGVDVASRGLTGDAPVLKLQASPTSIEALEYKQKLYLAASAKELFELHDQHRREVRNAIKRMEAVGRR